jgi:hypothetical protein
MASVQRAAAYIRESSEEQGQGWTTEPEASERRKLLAELFQTIWQKDGKIVAIKPQLPLAPYFTAIRDAQEGRLKGPKADRNSEVTKAGATGLEPATSRSDR